ncbi:MAG: IS3 family transposase [Bacillota bacterium]
METFFIHFKSECFYFYTFLTTEGVKFAEQRYMRLYNHHRIQKNK